MNKLKPFILAICLPFILTSCTPTVNSFSSDFYGTFDTVVTVMAYEENQASFDKMFTYAQKRFTELSQLFDIYESYDDIVNIKTINENAGIAPVAASQEIIDLLLLSKEWYEKSNGTFNVTFGSVLKIWHDYRTANENQLPSLQELKEANQHTNIYNLVIDEKNSTVFLRDKNTQLDVGAVAKGYATELVATELEEMGYSSFAISAGGNVRTVGVPQSKEKTHWTISIQSPLEEVTSDANQGVLTKVKLANKSVVTSGGYQRYYTVDGKQYHHLIDPSTLFPQEYYQSVTVIATDSGLCDILSTAVVMMPLDKAISYLSKIEDAEALFVLTDGSIAYTNGFEQYMTNLPT